MVQLNSKFDFKILSINSYIKIQFIITLDKILRALNHFELS